NHGPNTATDVIVSDPLPAGLTFVSATASQGSFDHTTGLWTVGTVTTTTPQTLIITARVISADPVTNTVTISHSDEPDPAPDTTTASLTVTPPPPPNFPFDVIQAFPQPASAPTIEPTFPLSPFVLPSVALPTPVILQAGVPLDSGSEGSVLLAEIIGTV